MSKEERKEFLKGVKSSQKTNKRQKTSETTEFQKSSHYITSNKDENAESMWGKDEKFNMEDLNLNLLPDDEKSLLKKKQEMKWDAKKKRYVQVEIGQDGKKTKNESGKAINYKKDKDPELYKKWMKRTHLKIQDTGTSISSSIINPSI
jgi:hypothetical protein